MSSDTSYHQIKETNVNILNLVQDLMNQNKGYHIIDNFIPNLVAVSALKETEYKYNQGQMSVGKVAHVVSNQKNLIVDAAVEKTVIRNDFVVWLRSDSTHHPYLTQIMETMDNVIFPISNSEINYKNGIRTPYTIANMIGGRSRGMLTCYPKGSSGYLYHVDNPIQDGRLLTAIFYLNKNWCINDGGELVIYPANNSENKKIVIEPYLNRLILFWSNARIPHEVLPSYNNRYALTLWYFDLIERSEYSFKAGLTSNP